MSDTTVIPAEVISINISKGGIPKLPVASVYITAKGLEGDSHNHKKHYRLSQAVCIQDIECLEELSTQEYRLKPGTAGENLTVRGLNVNSRPIGTLLEFSGGVVLELTRVRPTCYVMDEIHPQLKNTAENRHGMYAKVNSPGTIDCGETINIQLPSHSM